VEFVKSLLFSDLVNGTREKLWRDYKLFAKTYLKQEHAILERYFIKKGV
jgi:hypothetical protein